MITFETIGRHGRLGNQLFQYAILVGVHYKNNFPIAFSANHNAEIFDIFDLKLPTFMKSDLTPEKTYHETQFHYNENVFSQSDNTNFWGYFQTEKYFQQCANELRRELTFKNDIVQKAIDFLSNIPNKNTVGIHVRRGDYVNLPDHHPVCSLDYYSNAMQHFSDEVQYIVFSDDIRWCKENLKAKNIIFSDNDTAVDLCIMSMCEHNIIANSSYSWWGAWLNANSNKKIIMPEIWFGSAYANHNTDDLYPEKWIRV